ncbi:MAG: TlpA disulfide reductase family protein, partial [Hyphomonas sp.]|nr:TlpA disulfide reductase family protein [Hyphomonas sp.]
MKPAIAASAGLVLLAACATPSHHEHGVSTDPHGATSFVTADALSPTPAEPRNGERIARDADGRPYSHALLGQPLPALSGKMADGSTFDPASLDKWTVIHVWGLWCGDSMADAPYTAALVTAIGQDPDLDFLSIHVPYTANHTEPTQMFGKHASLAAFFRSKGYSFPTLVDDDATLRQALQINWTPTYLLVDPDGVVRAFRTDLSVAEGEPVKDFLRDVARVKAEEKEAATAQSARTVSIGPDGAMGLKGAIPFNTNAIRAAFPGFEVVPGQMTTDGQVYPVFNIVAGGDPAPSYVVESDWSLGQVHRVSTAHPDVSGPTGEHVGTFRLSALPAADQAQCDEGHDATAGLLV